MNAWVNRLGRALALSSVLALFPVATASAVDLTGKTLVAKGNQEIVKSNMGRLSFTWSLEIYYGSAGNRFVLFQKENATGTTNLRDSYNRVLIPVGENSGKQRRKDGNFLLDISLSQSASSLQVKLRSRGKDASFATETFIYSIGLRDGSCSVQSYKYIGDPRLNYFSVKPSPGSCTITAGAPAGLADK